jgi:transcriptional regulator with XRE-family HTH domain
MDTNRPRVRHYLREWRKLRGKSMADLAADIGVEKSMISRFETGTRGISLDLQFKLFRALDITPNEFFNGPGRVSLDEIAKDLLPDESVRLEEIVRAFCKRPKQNP